METTLPRGVLVDGEFCRAVTLRAPTGREEDLLLGEGRGWLPAEQSTALLTRCVTRLGGRRDVAADDIRALSIGDREALLLRLCTSVAGERIEASLQCTIEDCGERLEIEVDVERLLAAPYPTGMEVHEVDLDCETDQVRVRFRLPTVRDQELAAHVALTDPRFAGRALVDAIVVSVERAGEPLPAVPGEFVEHLASAVERLDPLAETRLAATCPVCGRTSDVLLDAGEFLASLLSRPDQLYRELHLIASHYHWSEADILALPLERRWLYVGMIEGSPPDGEGS